MTPEERAVQTIYDAAYRDRMSPDVLAWAVHYSDANDPVDVAREMLKGFCAQNVFAPSPIERETIRSPASVLSSAEQVLCLDECCAAFACALMSLGIRIAIVGQAIQGEHINHVIVSVEQRGLWYDFDPLYGKGPEEVLNASRELRVLEPSPGLVRRA